MKSKKQATSKKHHIENYQLYDINSKKELSKRSVAWLLVIGYMIIIGMAAILSAFLSDVLAKAAIFGIAIAVYTVAILLRNQKWMWGKGYAAYLLFPLIVVVQPLGFYRGMMNFINQFFTLINNRFVKHFVLFDIGNVSIINQVHFLIFVLLILVAFMYLCITERKLIPATVVVALLLVVVCTFSLSVSSLWIVIFLMGWLGIWTLDSAYKQRILRKCYFFVITGLCTLGIGMLVNGYYNQDVAKLRDNLKDAIDEFRYGADTLPEGDLSKADQMIGDKADTTLSITTKVAQEMYLRGYVGSNFDGNKWSTTDENLYYNEYDGMIDWMEGLNFYPMYQYSNYKQLSSADPVKQTFMTVSDVGADRKYLYLPYTANSLNSRGSQAEYDWQIVSKGFFGTTNYDYQAVDNDMSTELVIDSSFADANKSKNYAQAEQIYRTFVYSTYLSVDDAQTKEIQDLFYDNQSLTDISLSQVTQLVRTKLQSSTTYSDKPYPYSNSGDFVSWFLNDEKLGNASYYATTAVLAYRVAGIPARYVEGYYLSSADAAKYNTDNKANADININLSAANAHAWVEIYMDGVGWMPVEVVPGYYFAEYTVQQVLDTPQSSISIKDDNTQEELNGSTADTLAPEEKQPELTEQEKVRQKVFYILGIIIVLMFSIWFIRWCVLGQRKLRIRNYHKKIRGVNSKQACKMVNNRVCDLLVYDEKEVNYNFLFENSIIFEEDYGDITVNDYERYVALLQKAIYGEQELTNDEMDIINSLEERLANEVYEHQNRRSQFKMKYVKAYV